MFTDLTRREPWALTGAALGGGVAIKALALTSSGTTWQWLLASTVLLIGGTTLLITLLCAVPVRDEPALLARESGGAPPRPAVYTAIRRPSTGSSFSLWSARSLGRQTSPQ